MKYSIKATSPEKLLNDCLVLPVWQNQMLSESGRQVDKAAGKSVTAILRSGDFNGKLAETLLVHGVKGIRSKRLLLVGCGEPKKFNARNFSKAVVASLKLLKNSSAKSAHFLFPGMAVVDRDRDWAIARLVRNAEDSFYEYDHTKSSKSKTPALKSISIEGIKRSKSKSSEQAVKLGKAIGKGLNTAKQLGNLPGNICTPTFLALQAKQLATRYARISSQALSETQMKRLGMGSLLSVSAGSAQEAKLIVMKYRGNSNKNSRPYVLIGKGITFDTGGISLKPGLNMDEMKFDMCGAASVIGTLTAVAELQLSINVIGVIACAENMPGSRATKPGDIVTSMSGKTIEILNTDAEGRLVLCDALTYVERFKPKTVIDIATLTGAAVATFGSVVSALLSNDEKLANELLNHGQQTLDPAWRLPLWEDYQSLLDSRFADVANIGGPRAGTITAACFLSRFAEKFPWAHLDIAGTAWLSGAEKAATGRPVELLLEYLRHQRA